MSILSRIKNTMSDIPPALGIWLAYIPFSLRLGRRYTDFKCGAQVNVRKDMLFSDVYKLVKSAAENIPFYRSHYKENGFDYKVLKNFDDLSLIPIVRKEDLQKFLLKDRVFPSSKGIVTNTGGTSGQPLELVLDPNAYAQEWSHMHTIWESLGYKTSSIKLTLRGMNLGSKPIIYNFIHNEFQVNAYCDFDLVVKSLDKTLSKYKIEYLHGYPSGIYEFLKNLQNKSPESLSKLKRNLKGVFFGSEYPAPIYRDYIEILLNIPTISWYGHTEMAVLAREKNEPFVYHPFQSYGFTECVEIEGKQHLVGTTIHNTIGPLIRYDTGDLIEPISYKNGLLESFKVTEGRVGEFVVDNNGRSISLTALIFGRHHKLFEIADFVQVQQITPGHLNVIVTTQNNDIACDELFDSEGINMDIAFKLVKQPYKTKSGKVSLLVKNI
jgi:phenylacetate-CoA ligase